MTNAKALNVGGILSIIYVLIFLKLIIFLMWKMTLNLKKEEEKKRAFKNCMLQARGNLLSAGIRHGISFSHLLPCSVFQNCHLLI